MREIVDMRARGVTPDYIRKLDEQGLPNSLRPNSSE
jgi:hypothetical protein